MLTLPPEAIALLMPFSPLFSPSVWPHAQVLLTGSILTVGQRTVTAALRAMGLSQDRHYQSYHRVLNRARWSLRQASRVLLQLLVSTFVPQGPLLLGLDDTIERRWGTKIAARGIYRDPVCSSHGQFVKTSGLRWLSLMLLVPIGFAGRVWALPFLTALCPSLRYFQKHRPQRLTSKKLTDWARQLVLQVHRWFPDRTLVVVADSGFSVLELLASWQRLRTGDPIIAITRLRLDAALYEPVPERAPGQRGRSALKGKRLPTLEALLKDPKTVGNKVTVTNWYGRYGHGSSNTVHNITEVEVLSQTAVWYHSGMPIVPLRWVLVRDPQGRFEPQALLCTNLALLCTNLALLCTSLDCTPEAILSWYAQRWSVEVTFREARAHLGVETQRQWNDKAIARTTPLLLGLFSVVTLLAHQLDSKEKGHLRPRQSAWYRKEQATFSDALASVRRRLWSHQQHLSYMSPFKGDIQKLQHQLIHQMANILCYAA